MSIENYRISIKLNSFYIILKRINAKNINDIHNKAIIVKTNNLKREIKANNLLQDNNYFI